MFQGFWMMKMRHGVIFGNCDGGEHSGSAWCDRSGFCVDTEEMPMLPGTYGPLEEPTELGATMEAHKVPLAMGPGNGFENEVRRPGQ